MKITCLTEDTKCVDSLECEHGLSLYIEALGHTILFDSGQSDMFWRNAEKLSVDLKKVEYVILSHGHYDHSGGLKKFLEINKTAKIFMNIHAFEPHFNGNSGTQKDIGVDKELMKSDRIVFVEDYLELFNGAEIFSSKGRENHYPVSSFGLNMLENSEYVPDDFRHEQYLLLTENEKKILISGCSHKGILNITEWFSPQILIGGFHFVKLDPQNEKDSLTLKKSAEILSNHNTIYYTGHCTGVKQYEFLQKYMKNNLHYLSTGSVIQI